MKKSHYLNILLAAIAIGIAFCIGEAAVRFLGHYDRDGNFFFGQRKLKPYRLPAEAVREKIDKFLSTTDAAVSYDPDIGWICAPDSVSADNLYVYGEDGIRVSADRPAIPRTAAPGALRIAIFGDSYVHGNEVPYEETMGYLLEKKLNEAGIKAEVLNFGCSGYGMDQAFLRWKKFGRSFSPQVVISGFQAENSKRNVNLLSCLYRPMAGIPFSKPRFIVSDGRMELINSPAVPLNELPDVIRSIDRWSLVKYENWYDPGDYKGNIWLRSKLIALLVYAKEKMGETAIKNRTESDYYSLDKEPARLAVKITEKFKEDVESTGAAFYALHIPIKDDVRSYLKDRTFYYSDLLRKLDTVCSVIHTENTMAGSARRIGTEALFVDGFKHYTKAGNDAIAQAAAEFLRRHK